MTQYNIEITKRAKKQIKNLPPDIRQEVIDSIDALVYDPKPMGCEKLKANWCDLYRIVVGVYRVVYSIDDAYRSVIVVRVKHRREVYRNLAALFR